MSHLIHLVFANLIGLVSHGIVVGVMADDKDQFLFPELHQIIDESTLGLFIQIAAGFVQQDAGGITEQGAGQINLLLFCLRIIRKLSISSRQTRNGAVQ